MCSRAFFVLFVLRLGAKLIWLQVSAVIGAGSEEHYGNCRHKSNFKGLLHYPTCKSRLEVSAWSEVARIDTRIDSNDKNCAHYLCVDISYCEECGRRDEMNQTSTCDLTFDLARGNVGPRGWGEPNVHLRYQRRCFWNVTMDLSIGWFLTKVFWTVIAVTSTNYTLYSGNTWYQNNDVVTTISFLVKHW